MKEHRQRCLYDNIVFKIHQCRTFVVCWRLLHLSQSSLKTVLKILNPLLLSRSFHVTFSSVDWNGHAVQKLMDDQPSPRILF